MNQLCIYGEVLFDVFPDGAEVLGGAPFNVAWHLQAFSQGPFFISRVGIDPQGIRIRKTMLEWGMNTLGLQTDNDLPTGTVNIELNDGEPSYDIIHPSAYDNIDRVKMHESCQWLYHGSLALRNQQSAKTLNTLLENNPSQVFVDVNLRAPWWSQEQLIESLQQASWVKLNIHELDVIMPGDGNLQNRLQVFIEKFDLQGVVLTRGEEGAQILTENGEQATVKPEESLEIVDTVGAGDAFASIIILGLMKDWPLTVTIQRAQDFASAIVTQRGATVNDKGFYNTFINDWGIS